jgi:hypothetical protein
VQNAKANARAPVMRMFLVLRSCAGSIRGAMRTSGRGRLLSSAVPVAAARDEGACEDPPS